MKIKFLADIALEGIYVGLKLVSWLLARGHLDLLWRVHNSLFGDYKIVESFRSRIKVIPDVAKLGDWTKDRPSKFVNVV